MPKAVKLSRVRPGGGATGAAERLDGHPSRLRPPGTRHAVAAPLDRCSGCDYQLESPAAPATARAGFCREWVRKVRMVPCGAFGAAVAPAHKKQGNRKPGCAYCSRGKMGVGGPDSVQIESIRCAQQDAEAARGAEREFS